MQFIPSISVYLNKLKLKEGTEFVGVRIIAQITKSRFSQPFSKITLKVPYTTGLDPVDGLVDLLVEQGVVEKKGAWYTFQGKKLQSTALNNYMRENIDEVLALTSNYVPEERLLGDED
jgi:recombination protein RecA